MKQKVNYVILSLLFLAGFQLKGQVMLTPENALEIALKNNYDILVAKNTVREAEKGNTVGNSGMLPNVFFNGSWSGANRDLKQEFFNGNEVVQDDVISSEMIGALNVTWTLFDGMRMFANKRLLSGIEKGSIFEMKGKVQDLVEQVLSAYYDLVGFRYLIKANEQLLALSKERLDIAQNRFNAGTASKFDVLLAQIDYNAIENDIRKLMNDEVNSKLNFSVLLADQSLASEFLVQDTLIFSEEIIKTLSEDDVKSSPLWFSARQQLENSNYEVEIQRSYMMPEIGIYSNYTINRSQSEAGFLLSSQVTGLNYGVTAFVPIFYGRSAKIRVEQAKLRMESAQFMFDKVKLELKRNWRQSENNLKAHLLIAEKESENKNLALELMNLSVMRFEKGLVNSLEVKESQRLFAEVQLKYVQAIVEVKRAELALLKASGKLMN
jgi:outer membrane protein